MVELSSKQKKLYIEARKLYHDSKMSNPFFSDVKERLENDDDVITCLGGQRRLGKSTCGNHICLYGFSDWDPWEYMFFTIEEAMEKIERSKPGQAYFWDEVGTDYTAYRFMSTESVRATSMLEMVGDKNLLLVFTAPSFKSFAAGGRKCITHYVSVRRKADGSRGHATVFLIWLDDWSNKVGRRTLCDWEFTRLPRVMYDTYDMYKSLYLKDYMKRARKEMFLSRIKKDLPNRVYEVFFGIYVNDGEGLKYGELAKMYKNSTTAFALKVLKAQDLIVKESNYYHINPDILPK